MAQGAQKFIVREYCESPSWLAFDKNLAGEPAECLRLFAGWLAGSMARGRLAVWFYFMTQTSNNSRPRYCLCDYGVSKGRAGGLASSMSLAALPGGAPAINQRRSAGPASLSAVSVCRPARQLISGVER